FATAIELSASAARPYTASVGSATTSPLRSSSTAAAVARASSPPGSATWRGHERGPKVASKISVFTFPISRQVRVRFVFCETLPIFSESLRQKWPELRLQAAQHFLLRLRRWPAFLREYRRAFAPLKEANRVPAT